MASSIPGTNVPPVTFPGIASGIDFNSIITKLTSLTLAPTITLNAQIATLNAANLELIKINGLLSSVQNALTALSDPNIFNAFSATSGNTNVLTTQSIPSVVATPGTYVIEQTQLATATQITSNPAAGHKETDPINTPSVGADTVPLADSYTAITPSNGGTTGSVTINGVSVSYDVTSQSVDQILASIQSAVQTQTGDATFTIGFVAGTDTVQITDQNHPISLGSPADKGNLLTVLRLDQAQVSNGVNSGTVVATAGVGGINQTEALDSKNSTGFATDANFVTPVTSGTFTINGVSISVDATKDSLSDVIARINASGAGVLASFNQANGEVTLTNTATGPQSIVLGASKDSSNFLSAVGLTGAGATTTLGTQAKVVVQTPSGATQTVFSNSNAVTSAIPGIQLNLLSSSATPFSVTVAQDSSSLVSALNTFASAYNAAVGEIDQATAPPVFSAPATPGSKSSEQAPGGVLFGNADASTLVSQLENIVGGIVSNNGTKFDSLAAIGLTLNSSFSQLSSSTSTNGSGSSSSQLTTTSVDGTNGQLAPLDVSKLQSALLSNPTAVQNLFNSADGIVTKLGTLLTNVTGFPTNVSTGLLGNIPSTSVIQGFENTIQSQITSVQQQIQEIQNNANMQADELRQEFVASETQVAGFQSLQQQLGSFFKNSGG